MPSGMKLLSWHSVGQVAGLVETYLPEWCRTPLLVYLHVLCACQRLHITVSVWLVLWNVVLEACHNHFVDPLDSVVGLEVIGSRRYVHNYQTRVQSLEQLQDELQSVIA